EANLQLAAHGRARGRDGGAAADRDGRGHARKEHGAPQRNDDQRVLGNRARRERGRAPARAGTSAGGFRLLGFERFVFLSAPEVHYVSLVRTRRYASIPKWGHHAGESSVRMS